MKLHQSIKQAACNLILDTASIRIREMRARRGMGRWELAEKCGLSPIRLLFIECNLSKIDVHTCQKLGEALDVSWLYLVGIIDEEKPVSYEISSWRRDLKGEWKD